MKKLLIILGSLAVVLLIGFAGTKVAKADAHTHCICGTTGDTCDVNMTEHGHVRDVQTFEAISTEQELIDVITGPAGTYYRYLAAGITLTDQINFNAGVKLYLCFNEKMITAPQNNRAFEFDTEKSSTTLFSICDCGTGGGIQANTGTSSAPSTHSGQGGLIWMGNAAKMDIYGGTLQNGKAAGGGNLALYTCTVRMFGGLIKSGDSLNSVTGGNIRMNNGGANFSMYGGGLYGGKTAAVNGTEILAQGTLLISGRASVYSNVDNNYAIGTSGTANITISEAASLRRVSSGKNVLQGTNATTTITITGGYILGGVNFYKATASVSGGAFFGTVQKSVTDNGNAVISGGFFNKAPSGNVEYAAAAVEAGGTKLIPITKKTNMPFVNASGTYAKTEDTLSLNYMVTTEALHTHAAAVHLDAAYTADLSDTLTTDVTWVPWGINQFEQERLPFEQGYYYLVSDITTTAESKFDGTTAMYLCLNGHEVCTPANRVLFNVAGTSSLADSATECALTDCDQGGTDNAARGKLLYTAPKTSGNTIDRLIRLARSRQLYVFRITLDAREISNKTTKTNTGSILYMEGNSTGATFIDATLYAGETGSHSGGIYATGKEANPGTFRFIHSSIAGGKTTGAGGNIRIADYINVTIIDSVLSGGEAGTYGGNLYMSAKGTRTITGSTLEGGVAPNGGNIYLPANASVSITDTEISGGEATTYGGNLYISGATLTISEEAASAMLITGGTAGNGGNIYMDAAAKVTMTGGTISNGTATIGNGGNIFVAVDSGTKEEDAKKTLFTMEGGSLLGGTSYSNGGSMCVKGSAEIKGNIYFETDYTDHYPITLQYDSSTKKSGTLSISGEPIFIQTSEDKRNLIQVTGKGTECTIESGTFDGFLSAIGTLTIKGGTFYQGIQATVNGSNNGTVIVEGGEFRHYPQKADTAPDAKVIVKDGYKVVKVAEEARSYEKADGTEVETFICFKLMTENDAEQAPASLNLYSRDLTLNEDFDLAVYMTLTGDVEAMLDDAWVRITSEGREPEYCEITWNRTKEYFRAKYEGITAERLGDDILIELVRGQGEGAEVLGSHTTSVKDYCEDILKTSLEDYNTATGLEYTADQKAALDNVLKMVLNYGAAAQIFFKYKTDALVNNNYQVDLDTTYTYPDKEAVARTGEKLFVSATVFNDSANKIRLTLALDEGDAVPTISATRPNDDPALDDVAYKNVEVSDLIATEGAKDFYFVYLGGLTPLEYDIPFTVTATENNIAVATVTYSLNQYVGRTLANANAEEPQKDLAKALYAYGVATEAFAASLEPVDPEQ